jgi:hypothetical protein
MERLRKITRAFNEDIELPCGDFNLRPPIYKNRSEKYSAVAFGLEE